MSRQIIIPGLLAGLLQSSAAFCVSDAEWQRFMEKFDAMEARLEALEAENLRLRSARTVPVENLDAIQGRVATLEEGRQSASWSESVGIDGDFRYRYETIDVEGIDKRERNRIRARVELVAALPNNVEVGFGLASGGDDPISSNQTLGDGGSTKDVRLDLAYANWQPIEGVSLLAGKFSNPVYRPERNGMMWDNDWRPEGIAGRWRGETLFANFLGNWLESDSATGNDQFAWGLQGGGNFALGDAQLTSAVGYFHFPTKGKGPFYEDNFYGNASVDGVYRYNYEVVEASVALTVDVADMPLVLFGDVAQNQDVSDNDTGWQAGAVLGEVDGWGTWSIAWAYQVLEADAVLGLLADADFAGGGTDGEGQRIIGNFGINEQWSVGFTWYLDNEAGEVNLADQGGALSYDRFIFDTQFNY